LASRSSACAVAATAFKQGLAGQSVEIQTEGGPLQIHIADDFRVSLTGPASEICSGILSSELLEILAHEQP
jgi:diaminopimelate epimerase